jgi:hypothetical protein
MVKSKIHSHVLCERLALRIQLLYACYGAASTLTYEILMQDELVMHYPLLPLSGVLALLARGPERF